MRINGQNAQLVIPRGIRYLLPMKDQIPLSPACAAHLQTLPPDQLHPFLLRGGKIRGALAGTTILVNQILASQGADLLVGRFLGQGLVAGALLSGSLKNQDRLQIKIECSGPLQGLTVETNALGDLTARPFAPALNLTEAPESLDLAPWLGAGFLSITRMNQGAKEPFTGTTALVTGNLSQNLAHYFLTSEQLPTAFSLGVHNSSEGYVDGAGGVFLQAMPGAEEEDLEDLEILLSGIGSLSGKLAAGPGGKEIIQELFAEFDLQILEPQPLRFFCSCTKERFGNFISSLDRPELEDMAHNGPFPLMTTCKQCNAQYSFSQEELRGML
jgi:molecular chaperone Hsp33